MGRINQESRTGIPEVCQLFDVFEYPEMSGKVDDRIRNLLTNDYKSSARDIVEFYNLRGGKDYLKSLYGVRGFCVYDVSVMQGICTIK